MRVAVVGLGTLTLGMHRGDLFMLLHDAVRRRGVPLALAVPVTGVRPDRGLLALETASGDHGRYDLVVGADGSRSRVRWSMGVTARGRWHTSWHRSSTGWSTCCWRATATWWCARRTGAPLVTRLPGVTDQLVTTLCGDRTSPWKRWRLPG